MKTYTTTAQEPSIYDDVFNGSNKQVKDYSFTLLVKISIQNMLLDKTKTNFYKYPS